MQVTVDGVPVTLVPGMTVQHALLARFGSIPPSCEVRDRHGNIVGLSGAVHAGDNLTTTIGKNTNHA